VPLALERLARVITVPGTVESVRYRSLCKDGSYRHVESRGRTVLPDSPAAGAVGIVRDVSARMAAEAALRQATEEAERARAAAERAAARDRLLAEASRVLAASFDGATALAGLTRLLVPALGAGAAVDLASADGTRRVAAAGAPAPAADGVADAADAARHLRVPLPAVDGGAPLGWLTLARAPDAAPLDDAERALLAEVGRRAALAITGVRLYQETRAALALRDEVLAVVAHDLRSPLSSVLFDVEWLLERPARPLAEADRDALARVARSAQGMGALIEDLLDAARLNRGPLALAPKPQDLAPLLADAAAALRPLAARKELRLVARGPASLPEVAVDARRLLQAISNLVGNAVKFADERGVVTMTWDVVDHEVRVSVGDDGPGIPPEELQQIFGAFWQARHGDQRGLGLGLVIARGIVEGHGGRLWVESVVGEGSTFVVALPLTERARGGA
jgi:signal transduction histidine kinase